MALDFKRRRENQRERVPAPTLIILTELVLTCRVYSFDPTRIAAERLRSTSEPFSFEAFVKSCVDYCYRGSNLWCGFLRAPADCLSIG